MKLDIACKKDFYLVTFYKKDVTNIDEFRSILSGLCAGYCFESWALFSQAFREFIHFTKPRKAYFIRIGEQEDGETNINWTRQNGDEVRLEHKLSYLQEDI